MRIVLDLEAAQTDGEIGRYALAFGLAIAKNRREHEVLVVLNGIFPNTIEQIRGAFNNILPQGNIRVFTSLELPQSPKKNKPWRREATKKIREAFLISLTPDIVHILSFFECASNTVTNIDRCYAAPPTIFTLYDLISLLNPNDYLKSDPTFDEESIKHKIVQIITDHKLRVSLAEHDMPQEKLFSWDSTALRAINAYEKAHSTHQIRALPSRPLKINYKPKLAFVALSSHLQHDPNVTDLLTALGQYYILELVDVADTITNRSKNQSQHTEHDANWLVLNAHHMDRIVYYFIDSTYNLSLNSLVEAAPGIVILNHLTEIAPPVTDHLDKILYHAHGYTALTRHLDNEGTLGITSIKDRYPFNIRLLQFAQGVIVPSETVLQQAQRCYGKYFCNDWIVISISLGVDKKIAEQFYCAIEKFHLETQRGVGGLIRSIAKLSPRSNAIEYINLARVISYNHPLKNVCHQIFIDISQLAIHDGKTGIQRVIRSILIALITNPPVGYRIEPVYADKNSTYHYAREFMFRFLNFSPQGIVDEPIIFQRGDIFLGLDLSSSSIGRQKNHLNYMRRSGVEIYFVVYDLLPIILPHKFHENTYGHHYDWLHAISEFDGALCISRTVAEELYDWLSCHSNDLTRFYPFNIGYFHLGSDIQNSSPTCGLPENWQEIIDGLTNKSVFLMVSTIEPRKGHEQVLAAFEELWLIDLQVSLIIVGKNGWMMDLFIKKIKDHPELGRRLLWLDSISDEYLEKIYSVSTCLIAASEGEGFGLPIIEAAKHKLPIIARDLLVFREIADNHATFFSGLEPTTLATTIKKWLIDFTKKNHITSKDMPWLSWEQSTQQLLDVMLGDKWYRKYEPKQAMQDFLKHVG